MRKIGAFRNGSMCSVGNNARAGGRGAPFPELSHWKNTPYVYRAVVLCALSVGMRATIAVVYRASCTHVGGSSQ